MSQINRRDFLGAATLAGASQAIGQEKKLKLGLIGCGWYGIVDLNAAWTIGGVECVAVCDADTKMLSDAVAEVEKKQGSKPKTFKDYKELLAMPGLDGVIIATPPHWHALQFIEACRLKLPVYQEKPLAYDIAEGRAMVEAWKKAGNLVQVGFQRRQSEAFQAARDYIQAGSPGKIVQVDVNIFYTAGTPDPTPQPPPETLDWDQWCGPAPKLPYSPAIGHRTWRLEQTTGNGHMVDWGIHMIDATRKMLGEGMPKSVTAVGGLYALKGKITTPDTLTAHFEFETCPVVWRHRIWGAVERDPEFSNGVTLFGEKETLFVTDNRWTIMPKGRDAQRKSMDVKHTPEIGPRHMKEWLDALRGGPKPACTPEDALFSTATVQLGMIAYRAARPVQWDAKAMRIVNDPAAAKMMVRAYRAPYKHPGV